MCRWIAYRGETTALEHYVTEPEHSLISQSLRALESTAGTNGDGFGLGWYGQHPEPGLYRETRPAWSDENLRYLCRHLQSHLFFAHVRAATGTAVTRQNCHPFACGRWMFMHNGFVGSWNRLRRKVEALIPDPLYPSRVGTTDSEAVFLAMVGAGLDRDPVAATRTVLQSLCDLVNEGGLRERLRFTSALANGHDLYAFRFAENDSANSLYYVENGEEVIVVSEPFTKEFNWREVPANHVLVALAGKPAEMVPILPAKFYPPDGGTRTNTKTCWPHVTNEDGQNAMCGICGEIRTDGEASLQTLIPVNNAMRARGPDASGFHVQDRLAFGHRRLSILDLSPASEQPMIDSDLGLGIVFNGCIYNFRELRSELESKGYRFFSQGDTEVILKAYHAWGKSCVSRFKGMFAFALWERDSGRVVLARDRLGIKPLYYTQAPGVLRFASSMTALLAGGGVDTGLDPVGLQHFFSFHAAVPPPRTILRGVKKLEPAMLLVIEPDGRQTRERYWSFEVGERRASDEACGEDEWTDRLTSVLTQAVDRRRVADVPVGVLLSGGLDSSLLVGLLSKLGHEDIRTFSIGFDSVDSHGGDEFRYSDIIARAFSTNHQQIRIPADGALKALPEAIGAMSEPMVSHDAIAFYLLSAEVSKRVKVVQSGQGADEVFGGYSWYPRFLSANDPLGEYKKAYFDWDHADLEKLVSPDLLDEEDASLAFVEKFFAAHPPSSAIDKVLQIDAEIMMVDDPVKRLDNMSMAHGLEARVPFLDHEVVELAARIPATLKVRDGGKYILKQAARRLVPSEVIDRPKGYFPVPSLRYLRGPFLDYVRDVLGSDRARSRGLYRREFVNHMLQHPEAEMSPKGHSRLWQAALLEAWLQTHGL